MKHKRIFLFLASALLLCGCGKADEPENPYRLKTAIHETLGTDETSPWRFEYSYHTNGLVAEIREYENDIPDVKTVYEHDEYGNQLEVVAYTYASELMRFGASDEEPDKRTTYVYELKEEN